MIQRVTRMNMPISVINPDFVSLNVGYGAPAPPPCPPPQAGEGTQGTEAGAGAKALTDLTNPHKAGPDR
jgi:hypothetical protein